MVVHAVSDSMPFRIPLRCDNVTRSSSSVSLNVTFVGYSGSCSQVRCREWATALPSGGRRKGFTSSVSYPKPP